MVFMMTWVLVAVMAVVVGVALAGTLLKSRQQIGASPNPQTDRRLQEQAERISELEDELARLKEQADFTERLLSERHGEKGNDAPPLASGDSPDR